MNHYIQEATEPDNRCDVVRYIRANRVLTELKRNNKYITRQEQKTLRGLALSGDVDGAWKGLNTLLKRRRNNGDFE